MEFICEINGVKFYNDFNSQTVAESEKSLEALSEPVIWIAGGGETKENFYDLFDKFFNKLFLLCLLEKGSNWIKSFAIDNAFNNIYNARDLFDAVKNAYLSSERGTSVLYSPACTVKQGDEDFRKAVLKLRSEEDAKKQFLQF